MATVLPYGNIHRGNSICVRRLHTRQPRRGKEKKKKKSEVHLPFVAGEANKNNLTSLCTFTGVLGLTFIK